MHVAPTIVPHDKHLLGIIADILDLSKIESDQSMAEPQPAAALHVAW